MIRVMLVDDHASFRGALAFILDREDDVTVVGQAGTLGEARQIIASTPVDVVLVDLDLPDGHGLDLLSALHERGPTAAVILSGSTRPENPALAVAAGAVGFLHKAVGTTDIVTAIRRVANGETLFSTAEASALMRQAAQHQARSETALQALNQLTRRERQVLRALAAGLDNNAIAEHLYLSPETVRTHVARVLRKLGVDSRLQAALFAVRHGEVGPDTPA